MMFMTEFVKLPYGHYFLAVNFGSSWVFIGITINSPIESLKTPGVQTVVYFIFSSPDINSPFFSAIVS